MVNFENGITPINDANLNKMQTDLQEEVRGTVLYKNEEGTAKDVQLSENIENYSSYRINGYYLQSDSSKTKFSKRFEVDTISRIDLSGNVYNGAAYSYLITETASVSGASVTRGSQHKVGITTNEGISNIREAGDYVYITKVIGYKEV